MPEHSVRLAALAATLTSQQVTQYRATRDRRRPDAASRLAGSLNNLSVRLADLGRREDALAAIEEAVTILRELARGPPGRVLAQPAGRVAEQPVDPAGRPGPARGRAGRDPGSGHILRELAAARPDAFRPDLAMSLNNLSVRLADLGRREDALAAIEEAAGSTGSWPRPARTRSGPTWPMSLNNLSVRLADLGRREDALAAIAGSRHHPPGAGRGPPGRVPPRPGRLAEQPGAPAGRPGPAGGRAGRERGSRRHLPGAGRGPPGRVPARPGRLAEQPGGPAGRPGPARRTRWPRSRKPSPSTGSWPRPARTRSAPTWPPR